MVNYDVDTDPRRLIYFVLAFVSIVGAPLLVRLLSTFLPKRLEKYGPLGDAVSPLVIFVSDAVSPFVVFGILLLLFNRLLWRLPLIRRLSGIPDLEGTWVGWLKRISVDNLQPETIDVKCYITQTWQKIDFVFEGPTTVGSARTVGMFVENYQDIHVRYIYAMRPKTLLRPISDVDTLPSQGAAILRLRRLYQSPGWRRWFCGREQEADQAEGANQAEGVSEEPDQSSRWRRWFCGREQFYLQGTYHGDKMRRGDVHLEQVKSQRPTQEGPPPTQNKDLARSAWEEIFNKQNPEAIDEFYAPDLVWHEPDQEIRGSEQARQFVAMYFQAFPELDVTVEDAIAEDEKVVTSWTRRGTHQGETEELGPPTGEQITFKGITINRFEGAKIVEQWERYDKLAFLQQLGLVTEGDGREESAQRPRRRWWFGG